MRIRLAIFILVLLLLWWFIQIPSVMNAFLLFCTLGVNPFTNRNLQVSSMIELLGGLLALSVAVLFRREWIRAYRWLAGKKDASAHTGETEEPQPAASSNVSRVLSPLPALIPDQAVAYSPETGATIAPPAFEALPQLEPWAMPPLAKPLAAKKARKPRRLPHVAPAFSLMARLGRQALATVPVAQRYAQQAAQKIATFSAASGRIVVAQSRRAWWFSEPYIRRTDAWLERKMHQYDSTTALVDLGREMEHLARSGTAAIRDLRHHPAVDRLRRTRRK